MTIFFPLELRKLLPGFCKLVEATAAHDISLQEEANVQNKINALINVKYKIDIKFWKVMGGTYNKIREYTRMDKFMRYRDVYGNGNSASEWEYHDSVLKAILDGAWIDIAKRKMKPEEAKKLYIEMGKRIEGQTTHEQLVSDALREVMHYQYSYDIQKDKIVELVGKIAKAAAEGLMKDVDTKIVGILTKKIFAEKESADDVLRSLSDDLDSIMEMLKPKAFAAENAYYNLVSDRINVRNKDGRLIIEKRKLREGKNLRPPAPPAYLTVLPPYSLTPSADSSAPPPYTYHDDARRMESNHLVQDVSPQKNVDSDGLMHSRRRLSQEATVTKSADNGISARGITRASNRGRSGLF